MIISLHANHYKFQVLSGEVNVTHALRVALMTPAFAFDKDTHATWADVGASEIAAGNGYTQSGEILTGGTFTEDDSNDYAQRVYGNTTWTASGGDMVATGSSIVWDPDSNDNTVVGCIDYGTDYITTSGNQFVLSGITIRLA